MKKLLISVILVVSVFSACVVSANAIDKITTIAEIIKWGLTPEQAGVGEDELLARYNELGTIWRSYSDITSMAKYHVSYDTLCDLMVELNQAGYPCNIEFNRNLQIYVIYGTNKSVPKPVYDITGKYLTNGSRGVICAQFNTDSFISSISSKVDSLATNITQLMASNGYLASINNKLASLTSIGTKLDTISSTVSSISGTLTDKLTSMESSLTRLLSRTLKTDQDGTQYTLAELVYNLWQQVDRLYDRTLKTVGSSRYTISDLQYNTWQQTERAASRLLKTVDNAQYTVSDLQYNTWQQAKNAVTKLSSIDTRLSTLHTDAASLGGKLDNIAELLKTTSYTCGYKSNASGTAYPTQTIPYDMAVQIAARINSEMLGKQMTVIKQDGSGTTTATISRCLVDSSGYIIVRSASAAYYLCGKDNTIFVASQDYVKSIYSRMTDVISAVNNLTVGVDLSDVQLSVDASSINLFNNTAYCCGYQTDADGNLYPTLPIPYDSAAAIVERLNTDYVNKKITTISRTGSTSSGYLRHASITAKGYISVVLTNGYTYSLCDDANVLYIVDSSTNYGSRANDSLLNVSSKLDAILDQMQSTGGEYTCQHTYSQEMEQEATCGLPGLMVSTCSKCGNSYSEIVSALGHDWKCTEHVEDETDPDTGEITKAGYDIYTCTRCGETYEDHSGNGAPADYGDTSISKIIVSLFSKLGTFAGKAVSWIINLFDKALGSLDTLITRFSELTGQITSVGGDYPSWLSGFWAVLPEELQLVLTFAFICIFVGVVGRKLFFV